MPTVGMVEGAIPSSFIDGINVGLLSSLVDGDGAVEGLISL